MCTDRTIVYMHASASELSCGFSYTQTFSNGFEKIEPEN